MPRVILGAIVLILAVWIVVKEKNELIDHLQTKISSYFVMNSDAEQVAKIANQKSPRRFISYTSSTWEKSWLRNVDQHARNHTICEYLLRQMDLVHDFLNLSCTSRYDETPEYPGRKWCKIDDYFHPLWYDTASRKEPMLLFRRPIHLTNEKPATRPIRPGPEHEHILSKFIFADDVTGKTFVEYIEPLVAALRHPLAHCAKFPIRFSLFRGYVLPPPKAVSTRKNYYFDAGASSWIVGAGGPSLSFFWNAWGRQGIQFNDVYAFESNTTASAFYETVPHELKERVHYQQCAVSSDPAIDTESHPFLPKLIKRIVSRDD
jgi:hypothetical protein